jgi:hypothetical protein
MFSEFSSSLNIRSDQSFDCGAGGGCRNMLYYRYMGLVPPPMWGLARPIRGVSYGGG